MKLITVLQRCCLAVFTTMAYIQKNKCRRSIQFWTVAFFIHKNKESEEFHMKEFWNTIQFVFAGIGGWLGWFLGGCDGLLYALLAFVVVDYITGVMCAISDHTLSSEVGFKGICRKVLIFLLVGIARLCCRECENRTEARGLSETL